MLPKICATTNSLSVQWSVLPELVHHLQTELCSKEYLCSANTHFCAQKLCTTTSNNLCSKTNPCNYKHNFDSGPHLLPIIVQYVTHIYDTHATKHHHATPSSNMSMTWWLHGSGGRDGNNMLSGRQVNWNSPKGKQIPTNSYRYKIGL